MKYTLFYLAGCIIIFAGCKKDSQKPVVIPIPNIAQFKEFILVTWYYQSYDVKYYDPNNVMFYEAVASSYKLENYGPVQFSNDGSFSYPSYPNTTPTYQIKASGAVDSLIVVGSLNGGSRFQIISATQDTLKLESTGGPGIVYNNISEYAHYSFSHSTSILTRTEI